jgi:hypothetical protein
MLGTLAPQRIAENQQLVYVCCHCGRVRTREGRWHWPEDPPADPVSHGICRACFVVHYPEIPLPPEAR